MSLANAFATRRRKDQSLVTLNPQAAAQTMFTSLARDEQGGEGEEEGEGMNAIGSGTGRVVAGARGDDDGQARDEEEMFGTFIAGDDKEGRGEGGVTEGQGAETGDRDGLQRNGKRKGMDSDTLLGIGGDQGHHDGTSNKRPRGDEEEPVGDLREEKTNVDANDLGVFGLSAEQEPHRGSQESSTSTSADQPGGGGGGGAEDYNLPIETIGNFGTSIDADELQRFLNSTSNDATSPAPAPPTALAATDDDEEDQVLPPSNLAPAPDSPPLPAAMNEEPSSPQPQIPSLAESEHSDEEDDEEAPPPAMLDQSNLPEIPNLANLPDLPDLQVSGIPGSLGAPLRASYGNGTGGANEASLAGREGSRAASQDQVEMIRQIFNINPAEEYNIMATHEHSPHPLDPALPGGISVDGNSPDLGMSLGLAPPAPAPAKLSKKKKAKAKSKKEKTAEEELEEEYDGAQQKSSLQFEQQPSWVEPAPAPGSLDNSLSPATYSRSQSVEPVASGSKSGKFAKPKTPKSGSKSKNPIVRVVNERAPTPRNPNGSAPGASDFAPPEGGLTAREAAALFQGDDEHAHPCPHINCDKAFTRKSDFLRHYRIHTGERPFTCTHPGCGKSFIQRSALTVHERVHSGEKPHTCEDCQRQFSDSSSLARHRRIHQGLKPFKCEMCNNKSFSRRATLVRHQNICPGREDGGRQPAPKLGRKPRKGKRAMTHTLAQYPGDGDIPPPPGHPDYHGSEFTGSMSPGRSQSPEPDLSAQLGRGSGGGGIEDDDYNDDLDAEGEHDDGDYEEIRHDGSNLPPIPLSMASASNDNNPPAEAKDGSASPSASAIPSLSPRPNPERPASEAPVDEAEFVPPAPPAGGPKGKQTHTTKKKAEDADAEKREAAAFEAAARALDLSHAIDPSLGEGEDDPTIPDEQAAAVAALVEGFISPHIKAENLE